jgi:hypothetical protein
MFKKEVEHFCEEETTTHAFEVYFEIKKLQDSALTRSRR